MLILGKIKKKPYIFLHLYPLVYIRTRLRVLVPFQNNNKSLILATLANRYLTVSLLAEHKSGFNVTVSVCTIKTFLSSFI